MFVRVDAGYSRNPAWMSPNYRTQVPGRRRAPVLGQRPYALRAVDVCRRRGMGAVTAGEVGDAGGIAQNILSALKSGTTSGEASGAVGAAFDAALFEAALAVAVLPSAAAASRRASAFLARSLLGLISRTC